MQRVALRDVDLASFKTSVGADGFADGTAAVKRGAIVQMAWEASQQLLTGTVKDGGGEIQDGVRLVPRLQRVPAAVSPRVLQLRHGDQLRARRRPGARRDRRDPAARDHAAGGTARRSTLPWEQSLDSLLGTPQGNAAPAADETPAIAPLAVELSLVQNSPRTAATPATPPTSAAAAGRGRHPQVQAPGAAGAAGAPRRLGGGQPVLVPARLPAAARRVPGRARAPAARALRALPGQRHPAGLLLQLLLRG